MSTTEQVSSFCLLLFSEVKDPILLRHFGKREMLAKIDLMKDQYNVPITFDESWVLPMPFVAGQEVSVWGDGVSLYGAARGHRREVQILP